MEIDLQDVIFTMHPREQSVNIRKHRYDLIKTFILTILEEEGPCNYKYINYRISDKLFGLFEGEVSRYVDIVKLDLEKRRLIERVPKTRFYKIRIKN